MSVDLAMLGLAQQGGAAPTQSPLQLFLPMAAIFVIFYFLLIRPQQRKQKEQEAMLKALEKGDRVVTAGGLHGTIVGLTDDVLTLDISGGQGGSPVRVKVDRVRIERRIAKGKEGEAS